MEPSAMEVLLTGFGDVATSVVTQAGSILGLITGNALLLIPVAVGFMMGGVALVKSFK